MIDYALTKGWIPDFAINKGIDFLLEQRKREINPRCIEQVEQLVGEHAEKLRKSPLAVLTDKANEQHYEVPAAFYEIVLGKHLKYSCGYWEKGKTLTQAEHDMLERTCEFACLSDGQEILELGCGWGSLTLFMAQKYPRSKITAVSNSHSQKAYILKKASEAQISNVEVITCDINEFQTKKRFDRVVSVEMFEHVRNYSILLHNVSQWLNNDGMLFVHVFVHKSSPYLFEVKDETDWMSKYFFSGGQMPSDHLFYQFNDHMQVCRHQRYSGKHYQKTALAWLENMDINKRKVLAIFKQTYGDEASKWFYYWRIFFMACARLWGHDHGNEWFVSHYLFSKVHKGNL